MQMFLVSYVTASHYKDIWNSINFSGKISVNFCEHSVSFQSIHTFMKTHGHCRSQFASHAVSGKSLWLGRFPCKYFACLLLFFFPKVDGRINVYTFHNIFFFFSVLCLSLFLYLCFMEVNLHFLFPVKLWIRAFHVSSGNVKVSGTISLTFSHLKTNFSLRIAAIHAQWLSEDIRPTCGPTKLNLLSMFSSQGSWLPFWSWLVTKLSILNGFTITMSSDD